MAAFDGSTLTIPSLPAAQFAVRFGGFFADTDTPVLAANSPVAGTTLTLTQTVAVDVTDATSTLSRILIFASFADGSTEAVYTGSGFTTQYATGASTATITGGTRFTFTRAIGWKQNPTISAYARDAYGNEQLLATTIAYVYTPDITGPATSIVSPSASSTIATSSTPLVVDITDVSGMGEIILWAHYGDGGAEEIVFDGGAFTGPYVTSSTLSSVTNGYRYNVVRTGGWRQDPKLHWFGLDALGNSLDWGPFGNWLFTPTPPDTTAPTKALVSPTNASTLGSSSVPLVLDVTDTGGLGTVLISVQFSDSSEELAYASGTGYASGYSTSTTGSISNGTRFTLTRTAGWRSNPVIRCYATDVAGNVNTWSTVGSFTYAAAPLTDTTSPVAVVVSPSAGSTITTTTPVIIDVTDNLGQAYLRRVIITASFAGLAAEELVHDGSSYTLPYTNSVIANLSGGYRYTITRTNGWPGSPTIRCFAFDTAGNES